MPLTGNEIFTLIAKIPAILEAGTKASEGLPADVDDATNAATIIQATVPLACQLVIDGIKAAKD